ncbi:MAG: hypothetical protein O3C67_06805, partial [Cyanobacteria bacterium]|nr:hypothetical protein [Cyanobacteriota bacterium]
MVFNLHLSQFPQRFNTVAKAPLSLKGWGTAAALTVALVGLPACGGGDTADSGTGGGDTTEETATGDLPGTGVTVTAGYSVLEELFQTEIVNIGLERLGYDIGDGKELEYATLHVDIAN